MTREITTDRGTLQRSRCNHPYTVHQLYHDHVEANHWRYIGHHFISRDGKVHSAPVRWSAWVPMPGMDAHSIGICYEGGLDENGYVADTRTREQKKAMEKADCSAEDTVSRHPHHSGAP